MEKASVILPGSFRFVAGWNFARATGLAPIFTFHHAAKQEKPC
jgi:hypothetical protein